MSVMSRSAPIADRRYRDLAMSLVLGTGFVALSVVLSLLITDPVRLRIGVAVAAVLAVFGLAFRAPRLLLPVTVVWLAALGMVRRLISQVAPIAHSDPLLVIGPLALVLLVLLARDAGAFARRTRLANGVLLLSVLMLLGAVNPLGGSLAGGVLGLSFVLVPMLAFWVGRAWCDDRMLALVLKLVACIGLAAAAYGIVQTVYGFPSWDQHWIDEVSFASLNVGGVIRPFASFSSAAEYASYLALAIVLWMAYGTRPARVPLTAAALTLLIPALVLESSRGPIVIALASVGIVIGAWRRFPIAFGFATAAVALMALVFAVRAYGPTSFAPSAQGTLLSHEVQGLANPLDPQASTVGVHLSLLQNGVLDAFRRPLGQGVGSVTIAGAKFGGLNKNTETDPSNVAVAVGLPGLLVYIAVFVLGIVQVYRVAVRRHDVLALAGLGVVVATTFQWLNGGLYAVAFLPWLVLGWADRQPGAVATFTRE
jgi:hypothetical protein